MKRKKFEIKEQIVVFDENRHPIGIFNTREEADDFTDDLKRIFEYEELGGIQNGRGN